MTNSLKTTSIFETIRKYHELIFFLTYREIRIRYKQAVLGMAWAVLQPLLQMLVYTLVFSRIGKMTSGGIPYPVFVMCGLLPWTLFSGALSRGVPIITNYSNLVTKIYFPREIFPIFATLGLTMDFLCSFVVLCGMMVFYHVPLQAGIFLGFFAAVGVCFFAMGILFFLATANVFFRDVSYAVSLIAQIWFFLTPVAYPLEKVSGVLRVWYELNPMVGFVHAYRELMIYGTVSEPLLLIQAFASSLLVFVLGYRFLKHNEMKFGDII